jgi:hypothetical protein
MKESTQIILAMSLGICSFVYILATEDTAEDKNETEAMLAMVKHGASPLAAKCAISGLRTNACVLLATAARCKQL